MGDGGVVVSNSGLICCACSDEVLSSSAAAAVTEMAEEEESPDGDCDEDETTWPRLKVEGDFVIQLIPSRKGPKRIQFTRKKFGLKNGLRIGLKFSTLQKTNPKCVS